MLISSFRVSGVFSWTSFSCPENGASEFLRNTATPQQTSYTMDTQISDSQWPWRLNFVRSHPIFVYRYWPLTNVVWHEAHSTVWNLPNVTLMATRILRYLLDFWRFVNPILHSARTLATTIVGTIQHALCICYFSYSKWICLSGAQQIKLKKKAGFTRLVSGHVVESFLEERQWETLINKCHSNLSRLTVHWNRNKLKAERLHCQ